MDLKIVKPAFWCICIATIIFFCCPFIENDSGPKVLQDVIRSIFWVRRRINFEMAVILVLFFSMILWVPVMAYCFYRYTVKKRHYGLGQKWTNRYLFLMGFSVYLFPVWIFIYEDNFRNILSVGYWLFLMGITLMFLLYMRVQKEQLIEDDLSQHLIDQEE